MLSKNLLEKSIGILVVEATNSIASTIRRVFTEAGYSNVFIAHSVQDAFNTLNNNQIDWMLVSAFGEERLNFWHCLRLPLEVPHYGDLLVSLLINGDQKNNYEDFFALGAVSLHDRQLTYNSFHEEMKDLWARLEEHRFLGSAIGADVRQRLISDSKWAKLERFEEDLFDKVESTPQQKIRLIEARFKNGSRLEGMIGVKQILAESPEFTAEVRALSQHYLGTADVLTFRGHVPVKSVLILDPDSTQQQMLKGNLEEIGVTTFQFCDTIDEACIALHEGATFDLIITEWKINKVEGHAFIQHVRQHGHENQAIIVHSSRVKPEDMALLDEIKGVFIIHKPSSRKIFLQQLNEALHRWNFPQDAIDLESRIINALTSGNFEQALLMNTGFQALPKVEKNRKDYILAFLAFRENRLEDAKSIVLASVKQSVPSYKEISLLGKIYLRLGEADIAVKFLEQANQMVPGNIDRLCNLADASAEVGRPERAMAIATEARKIGGDIGQVQSMYAKHAVANGLLDEASELLESETVARDMVSFMNNVGIAHSVNQKWEESEASYRQAIKAMDGRHPQLEAIVAYNLGLSMVRQNRMQGAIAELKVAESKGESSVKRKAADLRDRVEKAVAAKQPLVLKEVPREIPAPKPKEKATKLQVYKGQGLKIHGLFNVLKSDGLTAGLDLLTELPKHVSKRSEAS